ncbi:MAG: hypothetical protein WC053_02455 [Sideroxydans sp.]|jgi:hypothetical protein
MNILKSALYALLFLFPLAGCSSLASNPTFKMARHLFPQESNVDQVQLDGRYQYIRVVVDGGVAFLASDSPDVEATDQDAVWFSAGREVLRFRNGRLVAAVGLPTEWRNVILPELPVWSELVGSEKSFKWVRIRDVMPGYLYGIHDHLVLNRITPQTRSNLTGVDPGTLVWFEESFEDRPVAGTLRPPEGLPPARYAVKVNEVTASVIYAEQCISAKFCFTWQRWPVRVDKR